MPDWREDTGRALAGAAARAEADVPLAGHTTFRIGGPADLLVEAGDREALGRVLASCRRVGVRCRVLGAGSNVLVSDQGLRGAVVKPVGSLAGIEVAGETVRAGGGARLDGIAVAAAEAGLAGAEFLAGIPGTVGGGLQTNAGAFGRSLSDLVERVTVLDRDGSVRELGTGDIAAGYRQPVVGAGPVVVEVVLRLVRGTPEPVEAVRERRRAKQPGEPSAGSYFKNPEREPAGALIDRCGLKGRRAGGAQVSEKHANFIINTGGARCADVLELAQVVKATVEEETGILLEEEVQILPGADDPEDQGRAAGGPAGSP